MTVEQFLGFLAPIIKWGLIAGAAWFLIVLTIAVVSWFAGRKDRQEFKRRFDERRREFDESWTKRRR